MAVSGIFHQGSGLGNQLFRYIATRVRAEELGVEFGMVNPEGFKGSSFMNLDMGMPVPGTFHVEPGSGKVIPEGHDLNLFEEKKTTENGVDIRGYDPDFNFIEDNTLIDGEFQDVRYFQEYDKYLDEWLGVRYLGMPNNLCIIGFRGGEFTAIPELFLPKEYYEQGIARMKAINPDMKFMAVTDDPETARAMLPPEVGITHEMSLDWRMVRYARYLILANSSFYILPALLNEYAVEIIGPKYWARRNTGQWATRSNYYSKFSYI